MAGQGVAVGSQPRRRQPDHDVAGAHPLGSQLGAGLHHPDGEAGQIEVPGHHDAGVLRRLAPDQRAARLAAPLVHAGDDRGDVVGVDLARGDVVEQEERLGPHADQVVDAHGDEVDAHRVVAAGVAGHDQLGAHPVGRGHQHRVRVTSRIEGELPAEPPDAFHQRPQPLDGGVARRDVDSGAGVRRAALGHLGSLRPRGAHPDGRTAGWGPRRPGPPRRKGPGSGSPR